MKHMKTLGLLALAVMALAAFIGTSAASAAKFTAGKSGAKLTETTIKNHVFTVTGSEVTCKNITFTGNTEGTEKETQTVAPAYSECTAFGFAGATVNTAGCSYTLNANGTTNLSGCTAGGITISVSVPFIAKCVVEVPNQTGISGLSYSNGAASDVVVKVASSNIKDEVTTSTGSCPLTVGSHNNARYDAESTVQAEGTSVAWDA